MSYELKYGFVLRIYYKEVDGKPIREPEELFFDFKEEAEAEAENCKLDPDIKEVVLQEDYAELWFPDEF